MKRIYLLFLPLLLLAACSGAQKDPRGTAVEKYLQAVVSNDTSGVSLLVCSDFESQGQAEAGSFVGVKAHLQDVTCAPESTAESDETTVTCTGAIIATYDNEDSTFEMEGKRFRVVKQSENWLVCGYE